MVYQVAFFSTLLLGKPPRNAVAPGRSKPRDYSTIKQVSDAAAISEHTPAIEVRNLRKLYGEKAAVDGLDLVVPRGCFFGFLGPNGAGKTTTIKMLMGLAPPTSGTIHLLGMPMPDQAVEIRKRIGLVPDESLLFDHLTGAEFLEFVGRMYNLPRDVARERTGELLRLFELDTAQRKLIGEYSKGMRKRVAMAASLIHRPQLFLMDEPFEGVDAVGARLMKDLLLDQVRNGATIFLTSHVLEVVERLCDRVAIIHQGKLVMNGVTRELRSGSESLEDMFVRAVGVDRAVETLDWL
ncbi:MAG: ABC transporter ATP-binding protein [Bryobacteraceae bacterium]|nr:ABC transporter ATP-binding protein [Bryobacteraceae bacterium]